MLNTTLKNTGEKVAQRNLPCARPGCALKTCCSLSIGAACPGAPVRSLKTRKGQPPTRSTGSIPVHLDLRASFQSVFVRIFCPDSSL